MKVCACACVRACIKGPCDIILHILIKTPRTAVSHRLSTVRKNIKVYMIFIILNHAKCNETVLLSLCVHISGVHLGTE